MAGDRKRMRKDKISFFGEWEERHRLAFQAQKKKSENSLWLDKGSEAYLEELN